MNYPYFNNFSQMMHPQQIQGGGLVVVKSIEEAMNYPVAVGNSVTFKIENAPVVCEKSQGSSQFEAPRFEIFDLVKRESAPVVETNSDDFRSELEKLKAEVERLRTMIESEGNEDG